MKNIQNFISESKTKSNDITNYGRSWIGEYGPEFCGNILSWFIKGVQDGMSKYKSDDPKFDERCNKCLNEILKMINKEIY